MFPNKSNYIRNSQQPFDERVFKAQEHSPTEYNHEHAEHNEYNAHNEYNEQVDVEATQLNFPPNERHGQGGSHNPFLPGGGFPPDEGFPPGAGNRPPYRPPTPFPPENNFGPNFGPGPFPPNEFMPPTQPGGMKPTGAPPRQIPEKRATLYAVDPGGIRPCLYNYTYVWLTNGRSFWFYPTFVGRESVSGYRWSRYGWTFIGFDLSLIESFTC